MSKEIIRISNMAKKYEKVDTVMYALTEENLKLIAKGLKGNKAIGIDKVTKAEYMENIDKNIATLVKNMKNMKYKPKRVRRVYIPKAGSQQKRPLGILVFEDKIVQAGMTQILNAIYEPMFKEFSFGFRPGRNCHQAVAYLDKMIHRDKTNYVVDLDIKGFFDNINHEHLIKFLEYRIKDKVFIRFIKRMLKSGVLEEGKRIETDKGTPQGGIISPVLGNIYLHFVLDDWFEKRVIKECKGYAGIVRYADDSVACFEYKEEAEKYLRSVKKRLAMFGLEVSEEKTKIIEFGKYAERNRKARGEGKPETFDFLGFTHYCSKGKVGQFRAKRKTSAKKVRSKGKEIKEWLRKRIHCKVSETIKLLNIRLMGYYRYYGITDNTNSLKQFHQMVLKMLFKILNRRTQKNRYSFEKYYNKIGKQLIRPKIYVDIVKMAYAM